MDDIFARIGYTDSTYMTVEYTKDQLYRISQRVLGLTDFVKVVSEDRVEIEVSTGDIPTQFFERRSLFVSMQWYERRGPSWLDRFVPINGWNSLRQAPWFKNDPPRDNMLIFVGRLRSGDMVRTDVINVVALVQPFEMDFEKDELEALPASLTWGDHSEQQIEDSFPSVRLSASVEPGCTCLWYEQRAGDNHYTAKNNMITKIHAGERPGFTYDMGKTVVLICAWQGGRVSRSDFTTVGYSRNQLAKYDPVLESGDIIYFIEDDDVEKIRLVVLVGTPGTYYWYQRAEEGGLFVEVKKYREEIYGNEHRAMMRMNVSDISDVVCVAKFRGTRVRSKFFGKDMIGPFKRRFTQSEVEALQVDFDWKRELFKMNDDDDDDEVVLKAAREKSGQYALFIFDTELDMYVCSKHGIERYHKSDVDSQNDDDFYDFASLGSNVVILARFEGDPTRLVRTDIIPNLNLGITFTEQEIEDMGGGHQPLKCVEIGFVNDGTVNVSVSITEPGEYCWYVKKQDARCFKEDDSCIERKRRQLDAGDNRISPVVNLTDTVFVVGILKSQEKVRTCSLNVSERVHPFRMEMRWRELLKFPQAPDIKWQSAVQSEMVAVVDYPIKCAFYHEKGASQMFVTSRVVFLDDVRGVQLVETATDDTKVVLVCVLDNGSTVRTPFNKLVQRPSGRNSTDENPTSEVVEDEPAGLKPDSRKKWIYVALGVLGVIGLVVVALLGFYCARARKRVSITHVIEPQMSHHDVRPQLRKSSFWRRSRSTSTNCYNNEGMRPPGM